MLTRFDNGVFNEGGDLGFRLHLYSIANNVNKVINIKTMHNHMLKVIM